MSDPIIEVRNLSKKYRLGDFGRHTFREHLDEWWHSLWKKNGDHPTHRLPPADTPPSANGNGRQGTNEERTKNSDFWALKDVSFTVEPGEVLGIIGRNGAGKSTLLKILSRITEPSSGEAIISGRVASLLEVGTGFHPELTGRENIYLNGAILGMKKTEIHAKLDEIVEFAEISKFIDTPVKRYSSGMYVRLAFAVAAHLEPEILILDEVLAVGDASFQKKCLGKMGDVAKEGRTVLFVSHNLTAIQTMCRRAIWLDEGRVREDAPAETVVSRYLDISTVGLTSRTWDDMETAPGDHRVRLLSVRVHPEGGEPADTISVDTPVMIEFEFRNFMPNAKLNLSVVLYTIEDICVLNTVCRARILPCGAVRGVCTIPAHFLNDETYRVRVLIVKDESVALIDLPSVALFEVRDIEREGNWFGKCEGVVRPQFDWTLKSKGEGETATCRALSTNVAV